MLDFSSGWHFLFGIAVLAATVAAAVHAVMWKREPRAALGWLGLILVFPGFGALMYWGFGINRIQRKAEALYRDHEAETRPPAGSEVDPDELETPDHPHLDDLARFVGRVAKAPLYRGNSVRVFDSGGEAYGAMLEAIRNAERSVALLTYIFDSDPTGYRFRDALVEAATRGVAVRVLIDAVGDRYRLPPMHRMLVERGVDARVFMPTWWPWRMAYANLRNHRKLLVADGRRAFTGGMNIREGHVLEDDPPYPVRDLHFQVDGPIVRALQSVFADDWAFTTGERLSGDAWFPDDLESVGDVVARAIDDGPAERFGVMRWTFLAALACARERVRIATPYFLPEEGLITGLAMAARRGVEVEILLPASNNLKLVEWASTALLWQVLEAGCRVFLVPPPFDHSKLLVIDSAWALVGSANWDPRSLRLNFELDVECYSSDLARHLDEILDAKRALARETSLEEVDARPFWVRLRDGAARLATPYL